MGRKAKAVLEPEPIPKVKPSDRFFRFCKRYVKHTKGRWAGKPFIPEPWQMQKIFCPLFDTIRPDGLRQYRETYVEMGRKNGKSLKGAALALFCLLFDNEPGAEVVSAAGKRDQARIIFDHVKKVVKADPTLDALCKVKRDVIESIDGGTYSVISADAMTNHGGNISCLIFDELWVQKNRLLYEALTTGMGAREQPITYLCGTAGFDKTSLAYEKRIQAEKVRDGIIKDPTFLPVLFGAADDDDWKDKEVWKKANPNLGVSISMEFLENKFKEAEQNAAAELAFRQLYLSQWVSNASKWFQTQVLESCFVQEQDWPDFKGEETWLGMDLSATEDLTSVARCFSKDGFYWLDVKSWAPEGAGRNRRNANRVVYDQWAPEFIIIIPGDVIDYEPIIAHIEGLRDAHQVMECATDRWNAQATANKLQSDGLEMVVFPQNHATMHPAIQDFETLAMTGKLKIRFNPVFRWAFENVTIVRNQDDLMKIDKRKSADKVDPIQAVVMALARCRFAEAQGASCYEEG
jgi:phage terminase large subunit-like protein